MNTVINPSYNYHSTLRNSALNNSMITININTGISRDTRYTRSLIKLADISVHNGHSMASATITTYSSNVHKCTSIHPTLS